ncbi:MAG TPA: AAA family ATPase [Gaiellaceae bacterium]|nr:AAA family ATPase [Gaiellaceae bacterium]
MLIGRRAERESLRALLDGAARGEGGAVLLVGEAGMGKTALLDDATERVAGDFTVLRASGAESQTDLPFVGLAEMLEPVARQFDRIPAPQARMLRNALAIGPAGEAVDNLAVGVATLGLLAALGARKPVLVAVDDLQWVDEPSRASILFLARRLARLRIALVCASRPGGHVAAPELPLLELGGLKQKESRSLLEASARVALVPAVRKRLLEVAAGNPLALVELPTGLSTAQLSGLVPLGEPIPVNGGIERAFGARVARLPERTRRALLLAAAGGADAPAALASGLRAEGLGPADLEPAAADGLVSASDAVVTFRHPLVRSVVYFGQAEEDRRSAHATLAVVDTDPDRRAWHLAGAARGPDEAAAAELDAAAGRALARGAPASAARALEAAAGLAAAPGARGERLARAARAAHRAGDVVSAGRFAATARELVSDPVTVADLLLVESDLRMRDGDLEGAHRALTEHAVRLVGVDRRRAATLLLLASKLRIYRLEAQVTVDEVERALALLPPGEHDLVHTVALSMSRTVAGRPGAREAAHAAAAAAARTPHGHAHTLGIAWPLVWLEDYDLAREVTDRAIAIQREAGFLLYLPQSLLPRAELDFRTGQWDAAIAEATEALEIFEETQQPAEAAAAAGVLARMLAARGSAEECAALAQRALASDVEFGLRNSAAHALAALGLLAIGARRLDEAVPPLETAERIVKLGGVGEPWLLLSTPDLVEALAHAGHAARALNVLSDFEARVASRGRVSAEAAAARCRGILDESDAWQDSFERALDLHDRVPTPFERARTELCYGERLRRARRRADARTRLRSAMEVFLELGAAPWAERARSELRASGEKARRGTTPVDALTEQELTVARLVARGTTNRKVAATLFVSPKTVEFHLGNVYRKLGVRSRTELARSFGGRLGEPET